MKSVGALLPWQDQYNIAEANIKLFCVEMTKCLELLSIRSGWETYHLVGNGRVWMLASKRLLGVTRKDLGTIIWRNALQKDTRMIICQICDNFEVSNGSYKFISIVQLNLIFYMIRSLIDMLIM
jgi:hypothetical protein